MWTEADIRFFMSVADKAGAYSWLSKATCAMYTNRLFWMHLIGIIVGVLTMIWSTTTGIFTNNLLLQKITLIVAGITSGIGIGFNNFDKLLGYDEQIAQFRSLQESNQLLFWTIYPALQSVGEPNETNVDTLKEIVDTKQKEIIKKYKEFPKSVINEYYTTFKDDAVDYNVLFNDKIDPTLLMKKMSMASINNDVIVDMSGAADNVLDDTNTKDADISPPIIPLSSSDDSSPRQQSSGNFLHHPRFHHMATIKPMTEESKKKRQKLSKLQQYELDKYLLNFE